MSDFYTNLKLVPSQAGSINISSFVTIDGVQGDDFCRQATAATDLLIGISQVGYDLAPNLIQGLAPTISYTPWAAQPGEPMQIFTNGTVCPLVMGTGGCTPGALLGTDANGHGIMVAPGSGTLYGAIAIAAANAGEITDVYKWMGKA